MKLTSQVLLGATTPLLASAYPRDMMERLAKDPSIVARARDILERQTGADAATALFEPAAIFDASAQYIDVSEGSGHEYVAPGPNDLRGPCPGLNAFANHNFLPHDGYATIAQFVEATTTVVGMGLNLATFLSVLGAALDGSGTGWSIGGTPAASIATLGLGGNGISASHNKYETDASPTRPDLYESGNDYMTVANQFQQLVDASPGSVTIDSLTAFRSTRFDTQIANNPYFFNGPFSGVLVQPAAYTFIFRFMANHSEANPTGLLDYSTLQSWFGVSGDSGSYTANQGQEQIPANWYRRPLAYPYETDYFVADVLNAALLHPKFLSVGGNTGTTNSFTGANITDLTAGVFNADTLAQGNNLACFAYQFAAQATPDLALNVIDTLGDTLSDLVSQLVCPELRSVDESQLEQFPGYSKSQ